MRFPVDDWQFWVSTGVVLAVVVVAVRKLWPKPRGEKRVELTIDRERER